MASTIEEIEADIDIASSAGFRGRLIARGQARAIIWRDGKLPPEAPAFSPQLSYDLQAYGYSLLNMGLRLLELEGSADQARTAFEQAATALESVFSKGDPDNPDRDFHVVITAAAYHLGRFSARAYSLLVKVAADANLSTVESMLAQLMLRRLDQLEQTVTDIRISSAGSDEALLSALEQSIENLSDELPTEIDGNTILFDSLNSAIVDNFSAAIASFLSALERGEPVLVSRATVLLRNGLFVCAEINLVPQWWAHRIAIQLLKDLWSSSFHEKLPDQPPSTSTSEWSRLREHFIAVLQKRSKAEIELWPSQIEAATRAFNQADDLVISLPTSAGKTRIAELAILRCLADGRRVVFVTPLRALSAQTEVSLQKTFGPLGKTISALYGSIGVSGFDEDAIRKRDIVVATPEKIDFALRSNPSLLDDVGLLIFDEGHMIGMEEREVRYEVQIQRLLKRSDAANRRIVCLSAILPIGDQLDDFAAWLRRDQPGGVVTSDWRPTRLRFGEVAWQNSVANLNLRVGEERPYVPRFLTASVPPNPGITGGKRSTPFPKNLGELCLATAWRLIEDGQSVLIYCPVRAHVEPFAARIIDLNHRGSLPGLLTADPSVLNIALALGKEWLGESHPILQCLKLGVAIHHGALPTAFRKEIERLLRENVLKITISSPTLAQGLNLSATAVVFHSLTRNRETIKPGDFKNIIGRAGRAYVDVEGLVLYPMFDKHAKRLRAWESLIDQLGSREMESGLLRLVYTLLYRMNQHLNGRSYEELTEYVTNNATAWSFPTLTNEDEERAEIESARWHTHIATLDTAILSMMGEAEIETADIQSKLDEILSSSLWERRLKRQDESMQNLLKAGLLARSRYVWTSSTARQRKGYFLAGLGLEAGKALDDIAAEANQLLVDANGAILNEDFEFAISAITSLATLVFEIAPFIPDPLPSNWKEILRFWLLGSPISNLANDEVLQFIETGLVYRLPWAMEAIRVRGISNGDTLSNTNVTLEDVELGVAVAAVETGTLSIPAAILIQAGFSSRLAAIKATADTGADFNSGSQLRAWLDSSTVKSMAVVTDWPTPETAEMWRTFCNSFVPTTQIVWTEQNFIAEAEWEDFHSPACWQRCTTSFRFIRRTSLRVGCRRGFFGSRKRGSQPRKKGLSSGFCF